MAKRIKLDRYFDYYWAYRGLHKGKVPNLLNNLYAAYARSFEKDVGLDDSYTLITYKEFVRTLRRLGYDIKRFRVGDRLRSTIRLNKNITPPHKPGRKALPKRTMIDEFGERIKVHPSYPEYCDNCPLRIQARHRSLQTSHLEKLMSESRYDRTFGLPDQCDLHPEPTQKALSPSPAETSSDPQEPSPSP